MQTNRDFYNITRHHTEYYIRDYDLRCSGLDCVLCRHGRIQRDIVRHPWGESCAVSWLNAPHDQPLDVRKPWTAQPPEVEPNPL